MNTATNNKISEEVKELIGLYQEPNDELNLIGYQIMHDMFLTPVKVFIYEDFDKVQFANMEGDNFALPVRAYKKHFLGDDYIDCNAFLKNPVKQPYHYRYASSRETCNVLDSIKGQNAY